MGKVKEAASIIAVELKNIQLHPDNGRDKKQLKAGLAPLVQSLQASGQLVPGLARPLDGAKVELICGRRRFEGLKEIKADSMALIVKPMTDYEAVEAMVTENLQREGMSMLEEVKEVKRLVALGDGASLKPDAISVRVGRPITWARRMLALTALTIKDLEKIGETLSFSPSVNLLARLTTVTGEARDELIDELTYRDTEADAIEYLDRLKVDLSKAAFNTGECTACTCNTATSPGLWDDGEPSLGMCLNAACYKSKTRRVMVEKIVKLSSAKPEEPFYVTVEYGYSEKDHFPNNVKLLSDHPSKTKRAGSVKCFVLKETYDLPMGSWGFISDPAADEERDDHSGSAGKKKVSKDAPIGKQIEAKEETLKGLRLKLVSEYMQVQLDKFGGEESNSYPDRFDEYGFTELLWVGLTLGLRKDSRVENYEMIQCDLMSAQWKVWAAIKTKVLEVCFCRDVSSGLYKEETLKNICTMTGLDFAALMERASIEKPEPKSLVQLKACQTVPEKSAKAKKK